MARKWNEEKREYKPYELPEGASCYEVDMDRVVNCARCGGAMLFGNGYTSKQIHTEMGFGYCVCEKCYEEEWEELKAARERRFKCL